MRVGLLGPLTVHDDAGREVAVVGARLRTLLILLALDPGRVVTTGRLADGVWGDKLPAAAPNALQTLVSRLRRALPTGIESHPTGYRLAVDPEGVDAARFERLVTAGRAAAAGGDPARASEALREALALWRGPALADVAGEEFARAPRARLDELRLIAWEERAGADLALGAAAALVPELTALVAEHPLRERLAGQLMRAQAAAGRTGDALRTFEALRRRLADELGADPSAEVTDLHLSLLRGTAPAAAPQVPAAGARGNLRAGLTSFVGRDADVERIRALVGAHRLTTLVGPGGAGKTRLAIESARGIGSPDGVWLVELAPVTDPTEVPATVLAALGLREQSLLGRPRGAGAWAPAEQADPIARLVAALGDKRPLIVLDNCEHLIDAAAGLADRVLGECPQVRVLATSREPLGITGEATWPVGALGLPPDAAGDPLDFPAVRLFVDRARAANPHATLDGATIGEVAAICRALDGMPLAIELAAARLRTMTAAQVAARLDDRFRLLTGGSRTALPRHQTLRAVVDWSWELLDDAERAVWRRVAVFTGGCDPIAATGVAAGGPVAADDVADLLTALTEKSLLVVVDPGVGAGPRYRMLETIREYGLGRLAEAGETDAVRRAHALAALDLGRRAEPHMFDGDQVYWLRRLADDHENLHAALRHVIDTGDADLALRLVDALGWYWWLGGHRSEGAELALQALALPGDAPAETRARAYVTAALNSFDGSQDLDQLKNWFGEAVRLGATPGAKDPLLRLASAMALLFAPGGERRAMPHLESLFADEHPWVRATARVMYGHCLLNLGQGTAEGARHLRDALDIFRRVGDRWGISVALSALAEVLSRDGEHRRAAEYVVEAIESLATLGTREDVPMLLVRQSDALFRAGDADRAAALLDEAERVADEVGMPEALAGVAHARGERARCEGDLPGARAHLDRAAELLRRHHGMPQFTSLVETARGYLAAALGEPSRAFHERALRAAMVVMDAPIIGQAAVGLADAHLRDGDPVRAAELLGAAAGVRGAPDRSLPELPRIEEATRAALGTAAYAAAYERGLGRTTERELLTYLRT